MRNLLILLAKVILIPSGLTAAASATDSDIQKNIFGSTMQFSGLARQTTLTISNKEMVHNLLKNMFYY